LEFFVFILCIPHEERKEVFFDDYFEIFLLKNNLTGWYGGDKIFRAPKTYFGPMEKYKIISSNSFIPSFVEKFNVWKICIFL